MKCATISAVEDVLSVVSEKKKMMVTVLEPLMIVGAEKKKKRLISMGGCGTIRDIYGEVVFIYHAVCRAFRHGRVRVSAGAVRTEC